MSTMAEIVRETIRRFSIDFIENPYLCYTEHGLHAYFFTMLYNTLPSHLQLTVYEDRGNTYEVCVIQKEYPTAYDLGKSRRQHWDIAVIKTPLQKVQSGLSSYDSFRLDSVIEFGLNEAEEHLKDDMERLSHPKAGVENAFIVHLYRLSQSGALFSGRDWPADSKKIISKERVVELSVKCATDKPLEIVYGMYSCSEKYEKGLWHIVRGSITSLLEGNL